MLFPICLSVVVLTLVGLMTLVRAAFVAPHGEEDETGFRVISSKTGEPAHVASETGGALPPDLAFFHR